MKADYDTTVARIAGNIMPGLIHRFGLADSEGLFLVKKAVFLARLIVEEVKQTEKPKTADVVKIEWLSNYSQAVVCDSCKRVSYASNIGQRCGLGLNGQPCAGKMKRTVLGEQLD